MLEPRDNDVEKTGWREIGWFVALWCLGVGAVSLAGGLIKIVIGT